MASKRPPLTFNELDKPKGKNAILRTAEEVAAEEAQLETEDQEIEENQNSTNQDLHNSRNLEDKNLRNQEASKAALRATYQKAAYRLSPEAIDAIDDIRRIIRRQYKGKILLEEVVEEAVLAAYQDLINNKEKSFLVVKFSGSQEKKNSRK